MDAFGLVNLAHAAGFVFRRIVGSKKNSKNNNAFSSSRRKSKTVPAHVDYSHFPRECDTFEILPEYQLVKELIDAKFPLLFVTGGAGTGKSTLIKWLMQEYEGHVLLSAPTAIAASNIGGKTLHSLCHLPLQWINQRSIREEMYRQDIRNADLLIIDEISLVNANLLDGVSAYLRKNRGGNKPFGSIPVVMVGDLFQLPAVIRPGILDFFERFYEGKTKFYAARCLAETSMTYYGIELTRTFRHGDALFVDALADIREGQNIENALRIINSGCSITTTPPDGAVWLVPRKSDALRVNWRRMQDLTGRLHYFDGKIEGEYRVAEDALPAPLKLQLKIGTQVMFTRDDPDKRWINGTIAQVMALHADRIQCRILTEERDVEVGRMTWTNFVYVWNDAQGILEKREIGYYSQFPLEQAWGMTIHKSQGKTLKRVHLDLGKGAFAFGQTYVALSRCCDLLGLTLSRPLVEADILVDEEIQMFNEHLAGLMEQLPREKMCAALSRSQRKCDL